MADITSSAVNKNNKNSLRTVRSWPKEIKQIKRLVSIWIEIKQQNTN